MPFATPAQKPAGSPLVLLALLFALARPGTAAFAQALPPSLNGAWRITRILPTRNPACWDQATAKSLIGSTLRYRPGTITYKGADYPFSEALSRNLSRRKYQDEYKVDLPELGIRADPVTEIDLQHEDADITGATTEIPGDTIILAAPARIIVSACGVFYEAVRPGTTRPGSR